MCVPIWTWLGDMTLVVTCTLLAFHTYWNVASHPCSFPTSSLLHEIPSSLGMQTRRVRDPQRPCIQSFGGSPSIDWLSSPQEALAGASRGTANRGNPVAP